MRVLVAAALIAVASPAWADTAADYLRPCPSGDALCTSSRDQFVEAFGQAQRRDYQGQRNVSYCLVSGCDGAVAPDRTLGCAWRLVILSSGSPKVDASDEQFLRSFCSGRLDEAGMVRARGAAEGLMRRIYGRPLR